MKEKRTKKGIIDMELSTFLIPPSGDVLVLGKRCPIGSEAAKRMLENVAPNKFEAVQVKDDVIDTLLIKKHLFLKVDRKKLIKTIIEETKAIMSDECMIKIKFDVKVLVRKEI